MTYIEDELLEIENYIKTLEQATSLLKYDIKTSYVLLQYFFVFMAIKMHFLNNNILIWIYEFIST